MSGVRGVARILGDANRVMPGFEKVEILEKEDYHTYKQTGPALRRREIYLASTSCKNMTHLIRCTVVDGALSQGSSYDAVAHRLLHLLEVILASRS